MAPREPADFVTGLFGEHDAALRKFLARVLGSEADAADVAQETYLKLYRIGRPEGVEYPRALLFRAAVNLASNHLKRRKGKTMVPLGMEAAEVADESPPVEDHGIAHDAMRRLDEILDELPPKRRRVLVMHKMKGMTGGEIAAELGVSLSMVEQHLARALAHCRRRLVELGLD